MPSENEEIVRLENKIDVIIDAMLAEGLIKNPLVRNKLELVK